LKSNSIGAPLTSAHAIPCEQAASAAASVLTRAARRRK